MHKGCERDADEWAKKCNVTHEFVHGAPAFAGNSCKTLLEKVDELQGICQMNGCYMCIKYVRCFRDFRAVVQSCFSIDLKPGYLENLEEFRKSYSDLKISITPKVHAVFHHVGYFCRKTGRGLGFFDEQSVESVHSDFDTTWSKYKAGDKTSGYATGLLRAVQRYNSQHV